MGEAVHSIEAANASTTRAALDATLATLAGITASNLVDYEDLGIQAPSARDSALVSDVLNFRAGAVADLERSVTLATTPAAAVASAESSCLAAERAVKAADSAIGTLDGLFRSIRGVSHQQFRKWSTYAATLGSAGCSNLVHTLRANHALVLGSALKLVAISVLPSPVQINGVPNPTTTTTTTSTTFRSTRPDDVYDIAGRIGNYDDHLFDHDDDHDRGDDHHAPDPAAVGPIRPATNECRHGRRARRRHR